MRATEGPRRETVVGLLAVNGSLTCAGRRELEADEDLDHAARGRLGAI